MFDANHYRQMYDSELESFGRVVTGVGIFDRRILWPRLMVPGLVSRERGEELTIDEIDRMERDGFFSWLNGATDDGEVGIPMYIPWRIATFARLESQGWTKPELREAAEWEEWVISDCLTTDHLAYQDGDVETLITRVNTQIQDVDEELDIRASAVGGVVDRTGRSWNSRDAAKSADELEQERCRNLRFLDKLKNTDLTSASETWRRHIEREAYAVRQWQEVMRVMLIQGDRARLEAGFSRPVTFFGMHEVMPDPRNYAAFGTISWHYTLDSWPVRNDPDHYPIRIPGFVLAGGRITMDGVLSPTDYAERYELFHLAEYPEAFKDLLGERRCAHCEALLPRGAHERRLYCSDDCSNAARQKRFRENQKAAILQRANTRRR